MAGMRSRIAAVLVGALGSGNTVVDAVRSTRASGSGAGTGHTACAGVISRMEIPLAASRGITAALARTPKGPPIPGVLGTPVPSG
jgi:hypothetical protein